MLDGEFRSVRLPDNSYIRARIGPTTTVGELLRILLNTFDGDYLRNGVAGDRLPDQRLVSEVDGELCLWVCGLGGCGGPSQPRYGYSPGGIDDSSLIAVGDWDRLPVAEAAAPNTIPQSPPSYCLAITPDDAEEDGSEAKAPASSPPDTLLCCATDYGHQAGSVPKTVRYINHVLSVV